MTPHDAVFKTALVRYAEWLISAEFCTFINLPVIVGNLIKIKNFQGTQTLDHTILFWPFKDHNLRSLGNQHVFTQSESLVKHFCMLHGLEIL